MFTPIHVLLEPRRTEMRHYRSRWQTEEGSNLAYTITALIRRGAGEDFLQADFQHGNLGFLEDEWDLKGISLGALDVEFPTADNFEAIDLSYAMLFGCKFTNATIVGTRFMFADLRNCEFINCVFATSTFYAASLMDVTFTNCDFIEYDTILNCDLNHVTFRDCFLCTNIFSECRFDQTTAVDNPRPGPTSAFKVKLPNTELAQIYGAISAAYAAGDAIGLSRLYFFKQNQAITRHNTEDRMRKLGRFFLELTSGYGMNPWRAFLTMVAIFCLFSGLFAAGFSPWQGLLLSAGAFFTFGANAEQLADASSIWTLIYILECFLGLSSMAMFVTVLARYWFAGVHD